MYLLPLYRTVFPPEKHGQFTEDVNVDHMYSPPAVQDDHKERLPRVEFQKLYINMTTLDLCYLGRSRHYLKYNRWPKASSIMLVKYQ